MKFKNKILIFFVLLLFLTIGVVNASEDISSDNNQAIINTENIENNNLENIKINEEYDSIKNFNNSQYIVGNGEYYILSSDYTELKDKLDNTPSGGNLILEKDYNLGNSRLSITKPITINGLGHMLNSSITISSSDVILKNIIFSDVKRGSNLIVWNGENGIIDNCTFLNNNIYGNWNDNTGYYVYQYFINWNGENGLITNSNFTNNEGDCAIYLSKSNIQVNNCYFRNNKDMYCIKTAYGIEGCSITDCIFDKNSRSDGVIFNYADKMIIKNSIFTNNDGNTIYLNDPFYRQSSQGKYGANCRIVGCIFINNTIIKTDDYKAVILVKAKSCAIKDCIILNTEDIGKYFIAPWNTEVNADYNWWGNTLKNIAVKPNVLNTVQTEHVLFLNDTYYINYLKDSINKNIKTSFYDFYINEYNEQIITKYDSSYLPNAVLNKNSFDENTIYNISLEFGKGEKIATNFSISNTEFLFDSNENLIITLLDNNKKPLFDFPILITLGESNFVLNTNNYGQVYVQTNGLKPGIYDLNINFMGSIDYIKSSIVSKLNINKIPTELISNKITTTFGINKNLIATLKDTHGNILRGCEVLVLINGLTKKLITDDYGQVKLSTSGLAPKIYAVTITFSGNTNYTKSTGSAKVTVTKATPKITAIAKTFKRTLKTKNYLTILKTNLNKVMKNTIVYLNVNKKIYAAKTNSKGVAIFKITKLTKKGIYIASVTYKGNAYYNKLTKKVKIIVK